MVNDKYDQLIKTGGGMRSALDQVGRVSRDVVVGEVPGQGHIDHRPVRILELNYEVSLHVGDVTSDDSSGPDVNLNMVGDLDWETCYLLDIQRVRCYSDVLCTLQRLTVLLPSSHNDIDNFVPETLNVKQISVR